MSSPRRPNDRSSQEGIGRLISADPVFVSQLSSPFVTVDAIRGLDLHRLVLAVVQFVPELFSVF